MNLFKINLQYQVERAKMERLAAKLGRTHPKVIEQSRKVDKLHMLLQRRPA